LPGGAATAGISRDLSAAWATARRLRRSGRHLSSSGRLFEGGGASSRCSCAAFERRGYSPWRLRPDPSGAARRPVLFDGRRPLPTPRARRLGERTGCFDASRVLCRAEGAETAQLSPASPPWRRTGPPSRFCRFPPDLRRALETLFARGAPCRRRVGALAGLGPRTRSVGVMPVFRRAGRGRSLFDRAPLPSHPFTRRIPPAPSSIRRGPDRRVPRGGLERLAALLPCPREDASHRPLQTNLQSRALA